MATKKQTPPTTTDPAADANNAISKYTGGGASGGAVDPAFASSIPTADFGTKAPEPTPIGLKDPYIRDKQGRRLYFDTEGHPTTTPTDNPMRWAAKDPTGGVQTDFGVMYDPSGKAISGVAKSGPALPSFYEGDAETILAEMDPTVALPDLQAKMVAMGLYGGSKKPSVTYGWVDNETISAFSQVLRQANLKGTGWQEALAQIQKNGPPPPEPPPPRAFASTNTVDLTRLFQKTAQSVLGREVSDNEATRYASAFQSQELATQQQAYAFEQNEANVGQTMNYQNPPSQEGAAEAQLKTQHPGEYGAKNIADQFENFRALLAGPFGRQ